MSTTPAAITDIDAFCAAHQGQVEYDESSPTRLLSDAAHLLTPTDCSGWSARMFAHFAGLDIGTFTGNECDFGQLVTTSKSDAINGTGLLLGDNIFFDFPGGRDTWDHVAIYAGNGRIWNHGGPGPGPQDWGLENSVNYANKIMVRRFLDWSAATEQEKNMEEAQVAAIATKAAQQVVENAIASLRSGENVGHWKGDGSVEGFNDRVTRLERLAGITKAGAPVADEQKGK